ncbi:hypothetical protein BH11GEM1_BH11GEM1_18970 [soil metagenome]
MQTSTQAISCFTAPPAGFPLRNSGYIIASS